jgi:hypothetical protein
MPSIVDNELAVRVAILDVATTGTYLKKVASPGRLYEEVTAAEIVAEGGGGGGTLPSVEIDCGTFTNDLANIDCGSFV